MNGSELPSARLLRTKILSDGFPEDHQFNTLATHVFVFATVDIADLTVLRKYLVDVSYKLFLTIEPYHKHYFVPHHELSIAHSVLAVLHELRK